MTELILAHTMDLKLNRTFDFRSRQIYGKIWFLSENISCINCTFFSTILCESKDFWFSIVLDLLVPTSMHYKGVGIPKESSLPKFYVSVTPVLIYIRFIYYILFILNYCILLYVISLFVEKIQNYEKGAFGFCSRLI